MTQNESDQKAAAAALSVVRRHAAALTDELGGKWPYKQAVVDQRAVHQPRACPTTRHGHVGLGRGLREGLNRVRKRRSTSF